MLTKHYSRYVVALAAALLILPAALSAQPRASERATVNQIVNGTSITFDFSRPVARGRDHLFGGVVHWGELWTPGANWATTLEVDHDVKLNGHAVPAGKYSVWIRVQPEEWTVFLMTRPGSTTTRRSLRTSTCSASRRLPWRDRTWRPWRGTSRR